MDIVTEKGEISSRKAADFDPLAEYKKEFFHNTASLIATITETRQRCICREDTQEDWIEIASRLEILRHHIQIKIMPKMRG